ncbi:GntR family transcriptional regulator [Cedecea davisae]|uniref:GntR family transcriptional regulator n=1 Tax=Cedecea davisae TaxID=158484 RepID=A0ABS6DD11_9ENTR|nr:GntR family transcriptional regulator [Cedecea davisae]MBU4681084.1 GntR family transcriptional regulator [Cedecea davisae]MBU4685862.1 GntR family transcriptional regulator [Cedecea davisae]
MSLSSEINPTQPVNQQVYRILRREIVRCLIAPGTPLSEKEVSLRFEVSRQPVREAFIKLAETGLVQIRPQRGTWVSKISINHVKNGCFIREAIECAVAKRAAAKVSHSDLYTLEHLLNQQSVAISDGKIDDFFSLDDKFHQQLALIADCSLAWETIENIKATMDRVRYMSLDHVSPPAMLLEQHHDIFNALKAQNEEEVDAAMHRHLHEISQSILLIRQEKQAWFSEE